jgi:hypothetical protein
LSDELRRISPYIPYAADVLFRVSDFIAEVRVSYALEELWVSQCVFDELDELWVFCADVLPELNGLPRLPENLDAVGVPVARRWLEE